MPFGWSPVHIPDRNLHFVKERLSPPQACDGHCDIDKSRLQHAVLTVSGCYADSVTPIPSGLVAREVEKALAEGTRVYLALSAEVLGPQANERMLLLMAFRSLALEHLSAILVLCDSGLAVASAFALLRPLIETVVRGEWLCHVAEDSLCEAFLHQRFDRGCASFRAMATDVDRTISEGPRLLPFVEAYLRLSDFTHTGYDAVIPRLGRTSSAPDLYGPDQIVFVLEQASQIASLISRRATAKGIRSTKTGAD